MAPSYDSDPFRYLRRRAVGRLAAPMGAQAVYPEIAGAYAAFGLRRLSAIQSGPLVRVRRSSDNAEMDVGTDGLGWLDTTPLLSWVGAGNSGFVKTWYDQSGNARHVTNATAGQQPRIVNAGVLERGPNGRPWIISRGSCVLANTGAAWPGGALSACTVFQKSGPGFAFVRPFGIGADTGTTGIVFSTYSGNTGNDWVAGDAVLTGAGYNTAVAPRRVGQPTNLFVGSPVGTNVYNMEDGCLHGHELALSASGNRFNIDGVAQTVRVNIDGATPSSTGFRLFGSSANTSFTGAIGEIVIFNADLSDAASSRLVANQISAYRVSDLVCCSGDSLTAGFPLSAQAYTIYPRQLNDLMVADGIPASVINDGINSQTIAQMVARAPANSDRALAYAAYVGGKKILVAWEWVNSMRAGLTALQAVDAMEAYCVARRAAGWQKIVLLGPTPSGSGQYTGGWGASSITDVMTLLAGRSFYDTLVNMAAVPALANPADTTYYQTDQLHFTAAANTIIAQTVKPAVAALL